MSVVAFANMLNGREEVSPEAVAASKNQETGTRDYIVILAGLVPAEILALHAFIVQATTVKSEDGETTEITDASTLKWAFWGLIALSVFLYVVVHAKNWDTYDFLRMFIPVVAFVAWSMALPTTAFDAVVGDDLSVAARSVIAVFLAVVLGVLAEGLTKKADEKQPVP
jgi:hypothetical protein